jgi:AcrR family transcriptional regulator
VETTPTRSPKKARGRGGERREEILQTAEKLFSIHGFDTVSTRQIAAVVGISQAALFSYFPTRDDLSAELCIRALDDLEQRLVQAAEGGGTLEHILARYLDFALENPDRYRLAFMIERGVDGEFLRRTGGRPMEAGVRAFSRMLEIISARRSAGARINNLVATQSIWASLHGLASLLIARPEFPWGDRQTLIAAHLRLIVSSVTADPAP